MERFLLIGHDGSIAATVRHRDDNDDCKLRPLYADSTLCGTGVSWAVRYT